MTLKAAFITALGLSVMGLRMDGASADCTTTISPVYASTTFAEAIGADTSGRAHVYDHLQGLVPVGLDGTVGAACCLQPELSHYAGVALDPDGSRLVTLNFIGFFSVAVTGYVRRYGPGGSLLDSWPAGGARPFPGPGYYPVGGIAVDESGNVYVAEPDSNRVECFTRSGARIRAWTFNRPSKIACDAGQVYVAGAGGMQQYTSTGDPVRAIPYSAAAFAATAGSLFELHLSGPSAEVRVFDHSGGEVCRFQIGPSGDFFPVIGATGCPTGSQGVGEVWVASNPLGVKRISLCGSTPIATGTWGEIKVRYR